jgi:hypothetical protein
MMGLALKGNKAEAKKIKQLFILFKAVVVF